MKKKDLLNEIMGVPKAVDFWVDAFSWILAGTAKGIVDNPDGLDEATTNYVINGENKTGVAYKGVSEIDGDDFMNYTIELMGASDLKDLLKDQNFQKLPLYKPTTELTLIFVPDELYEEEFGKGLNPNSVEGSHSHSSVDKLTKLGGDNLVYTKQEFTFQVYLPESFLDGFDTDKFRKLLKPTLAHELTHAYEAYSRVKSSGTPYGGQEMMLNAAFRMMSDRKYPQWGKFLHLVYLHLSFEINARISQFYYQIKDGEIKNYDDFMKEVKSSGAWKEIEMLENFNAQEFIDSFKGAKHENLQSMLQDIGSQMERAQQGLPPIHVIADPKDAMKHLIDGWDGVLQALNDKLEETGLYKGKFMELVPQKAKQDPYYFFKFFEDRFKKKAKDFKRKLFRLSSLITDKSLMGEGVVNKTQCPSCSHVWDINPKDKHPYLCHMCGYDSMKKEYNDKEMMKFWDNELSESEGDFDDFGFVPEFEENPAKEFLYNLLSELKPEPTGRGHYILYKDKKGKTLIAEELTTGGESHLIVDYHSVWKKLEKMGLSHAQIQDLCTEVFKKIFDKDVFLVLNSLQF